MDSAAITRDLFRAHCLGAVGRAQCLGAHCLRAHWLRFRAARGIASSRRRCGARRPGQMSSLERGHGEQALREFPFAGLAVGARAAGVQLWPRSVAGARAPAGGPLLATREGAASARAAAAIGAQAYSFGGRLSALCHVLRQVFCRRRLVAPRESVGSCLLCVFLAPRALRRRGLGARGRATRENAAV